MSEGQAADLADHIKEPEIIECEYFVFRCGFVHAYINLKRRLFQWKDSNQWNKNYVRSLSKENTEKALKIIQQLPYEPQNDPKEVERSVSERYPFFWRITISDCKNTNTYEGNDPSDDFLRKFMSLIEETSGITLFW